MNKKVGFFSLAGGVFSAIIGFLGASCVFTCASVCGGISIAGLLVTLLGAGTAGFLRQYHAAFMVAGILLFLAGLFLIFRKSGAYSCCSSQGKDVLANIGSNQTQSIVRKAYGKIAKEKGESGCGSCGSESKAFAKTIGYSDEELKIIPSEANLGLSCGNPTALAALKEGETMLDLGSGAGFDCFLAAKRVGAGGRTIGVDMTPEMIEKARENARKNNVKNAEFRLGEIENLPVADNSVDAVISNCVINLSADKPKVFGEIFRVLKPGGRVAISDIALKKELPQKIKQSIEAYVGCVAGAMVIDEYEKIVGISGLKSVKITVKGASACISPDTKDPLGRAILDSLDKGASLDDYIVSIYVEAGK